MLPDFTNNWDLAVAVFIMPIAVQWWAVWYPGAEPGGGSYIAQRMLASKSEKDALGAVLFFNIAHYVLRRGRGSSSRSARSSSIPSCRTSSARSRISIRSCSATTSPIRRCCKFLPAGFVGLMVGGLIAANSSTILTHLNWGASYLVHDFYRRFIRRDATRRTTSPAGRVATVVLFVCSSAIVYLLDTAKDAFDIILQVGAGTGLLYLVRWFWWRVNAWCEVVAMISSFVVSVAAARARAATASRFSTHAALLITIAVTTVCWVATAYLGPATDRATLISFYGRSGRPVRDGRRSAAGRIRRGASSPDNIPLALLGWVAGCTAIWSALFTVGNFLYLRNGAAFAMLAVFVVSGAILVAVVRQLWSSGDEARSRKA